MQQVLYCTKRVPRLSTPFVTRVDIEICIVQIIGNKVYWLGIAMALVLRLQTLLGKYVTKLEQEDSISRILKT